MLDLLTGVVDAVYATLQDWVDGTASFGRFIGYLLLCLAISVLFYFLF